MRKMIFTLVSVLSVNSAFGAEKGTISGTLTHPENVKAVVAIDRSEKDEKFPGKFDPKTGEFSIPNLHLEHEYDLIIDYAEARLEGVNLKVAKTDYVEEEPPFTKADVKKLSDLMRKLNVFEDTIEVLAIGGNCQHSAVLVNKLRTKPFYDSKPGEWVWRCEVWRFDREELDEAWIKEQDTLFTIHYRERLQQKVYEKKSLTFDPRLGGLKLTEKEPALKLDKIEAPDTKAGVRVRNAPTHPEAKEEKN